MGVNEEREQLESMIVSALLQDRESFEEILFTLEEEDFLFEDMRSLFAAIKTNEDVPVLLRTSKLTPAEFGNLIALNPLPSTAYGFAKQLKETSLKQQMHRILKDSGDVTDSIDKITSLFDKANMIVGSETVTIQEAMHNAVGQMLKAIDDKDKILYTPWANLTYFIGGLMPGRLVTIAGRPGTGKSAFALALSLHVSAKKKVLYISLEMLSEELAMRMFSTDTGISTIKMLNGKISADDYYNFDSTIKKHTQSKLVVNNKAKSISEIKRLIGKVKPDLVVIDSINLMTAKGENERVRLMSITRELKQIALLNKICVIMVAQLSRAAENQSVATLSMLKETSSIEEDSDICLLLSEVREEKEFDNINDSFKSKHGHYMLNPINGFTETMKNNDKIILCNIAKNRTGSPGIIAFLCEAKKYNFRELPEDLIIV